MEDLKNDYNSEPVYYCKRCLSLKIKDIGSEDTEYCEDCGSTNIETDNIENWQELYKKRFGHYYLETY